MDFCRKWRNGNRQIFFGKLYLYICGKSGGQIWYCGNRQEFYHECGQCHQSGRRQLWMGNWSGSWMPAAYGRDSIRMSGGSGTQLRQHSHASWTRRYWKYLHWSRFSQSAFVFLQGRNIGVGIGYCIRWSGPDRKRNPDRSFPHVWQKSKWNPTGRTADKRRIRIRNSRAVLDAL